MSQSMRMKDFAAGRSLPPPDSPRPITSERGAILIQAAIAALVLSAFTVFVVDYGMLWLSRRQAQNAADAGATAGALARAYDDLADPPSPGGIAVQSAALVAQTNPVWFEAPATVVSFDCPAGVTGGRCARVDVYRNGEFGSAPLPMIFGPLLGITSQGVRATAVAQVAVGNVTNCLRPFAIPDRWIEESPTPSTWTPDDVFNRYVEAGPGAGTLLDPNDDYSPPDVSGPGTGLTLTDSLGAEMTLMLGNPSANEPIIPGRFLPLDLPGSATYGENIASCNGRPVVIGQVLPTSAQATAPTTAGFDALIAQDPGASWNTTERTVQGSCAPACAPVSPRMVAIALYDIDLFQYRRATNDWSACPAGGRCVDIVNVVGFFVDRVEASGDVVGYLGNYPGLVSRATPALVAQSSFLKAMTLVR